MRSETASKYRIGSQPLNSLFHYMQSVNEKENIRMDCDSVEAVSMSCQMMFLIALATVGVFAITGNPPLFLIALAAFVSLGCYLQRHYKPK